MLFARLLLFFVSLLYGGGGVWILASGQDVVQGVGFLCGGIMAAIGGIYIRKFFQLPLDD